MTITDLRCDVCGRTLGHLSGIQGPDGSDPELPGASGMPGAIRFVYDPGVPELRDDSGLTCEPCWQRLTTGFAGFGTSASHRCASCGEPVSRLASLRLKRFDDPRSWRLCARHTVAFLNALRTVEPKFDPATFRFPADCGPE